MQSSEDFEQQTKPQTEPQHVTAPENNEELYRLLVRNFPNGSVVLFDRDMRFLLAEGTGMADVGWSREMVEGKYLHEISTPEQYLQLQPLYRAALAGKPSVMEMEMRGHVRQAHIIPVKNGAGEIYAGMVVTQDITKLRRTEESLRQSAGLLRTLLQNIPHGSVSVLDRDLRYVLIEGKALEEAGISSSQLVGRTLAELYPQEIVDFVSPYYSRVFAGESVEFELLIESQLFAITAAPLRDKQNSISSMIVMTQNITERKRIERVQSQASAIMVSTEDAIISATPDAIITGWNAGAQRLYGYTAEEMIGRAFDVLVPADKHPQYLNNREIMKKGDSTMLIKTTRVRKDGSLVNVSVRVSPVCGVQGELLGLYTVERNITEEQ